MNEDGSNQISSGGSATARPVARPRYDYTARGAAVGPAAGKASAAVLGDPQITKVYQLAWLGAFLCAFGVLYATNFKWLVKNWIDDVSWSHGFAIPVLAGVLVSAHWDRLRRSTVRGAWVGLGILAFGVVAQILFRITGQIQMSHLSMLVVFLGATLFVFGWDFLRIAWMPIAYLGFMIPPPSTLYQKITAPLQTLAAEAGTLLLPMFGVRTQRFGTIVEVYTGSGWDELNVDEACSGIRMLLAFVALAVVLAYTSNRPAWQKLTLVACSIPVAILCNAVRVTLTGAIYVYMGPEWAAGAAHGLLGFLMLIPAMGLQLGAGWALDRAFVEVPEEAAASNEPRAEAGV